MNKFPRTEVGGVSLAGLRATLSRRMAHTHEENDRCCELV